MGRFPCRLAAAFRVGRPFLGVPPLPFRSFRPFGFSDQRSMSSQPLGRAMTTTWACNFSQVVARSTPTPVSSLLRKPVGLAVVGRIGSCRR